MKALPPKAKTASAGRPNPGDTIPPAVAQLTVGPDDGAGQRLDNFLMRHFRGVPKSHLYRIIRSGEIRVNGGRRRADDRLAEGDRVRIPPTLAADARESSLPATGLSAPPWDTRPIFEDEHLLVVDKPAGLAVHGGSGVAHGVIERLRAARPEARFLELAHRLDRETSGVLVICKRRQALLALHAQWRDRVTEKRYLAVVRGRWPLRSKTLSQPLERYLTAEGERRVAVRGPGQGQEAITRVQGLRRGVFTAADDREALEFTLVEVRIETGRTHQIRVHLAHAGFPILGDDKYGDFGLNRRLGQRGLGRMFLHAETLGLRHPASGQAMRFQSPMPSAFDQIVPAALAQKPLVTSVNESD